MTAIPAHKHPLVLSRARHSSHILRHMTWRIQEKEAAVAKIIISSGERTEWDPRFLLKRQLAEMGMIDDSA